MLKKTWSKPEVTEQQIGLEVTSYAPAEVEAACTR
jgi:coenzyme PQQ precursor peptide PqqA